MGLGREKTEKAIEWDIHQVVDSTPLEFTEVNNVNLQGIEPATSLKAFSGLKTIESEREILIQSSIKVLELEINTTNLPIFEELSRKWLKNRTQGYDLWKKSEKDFSIKYNALIDAKYNKEMLVNKGWEDKLSNAKNFFKNQEKQKAKELNDSRIEKISPWVENADQMDFKEFSDEDFDDFVFGKKIKHEQRIEEEKAEIERIEAEKVEKEKEIESQRIENVKLKAEAEAREAKAQSEQKERERLAKIESDKLAKERSENEAKLKAEAEARAKVESELKAKKEAELKAENERIAKDLSDKKEADKLAKAPIKKQLGVWVDSFEIALPILDNETTLDISRKFESFKKWAKLEIEKL